jgi:hypothetical protein
MCVTHIRTGQIYGLVFHSRSTSLSPLLCIPGYRQWTSICFNFARPNSTGEWILVRPQTPHLKWTKPIQVSMVPNIGTWPCFPMNSPTQFQAYSQDPIGSVLPRISSQIIRRQLIKYEPVI